MLFFVVEGDKEIEGSEEARSQREPRRIEPGLLQSRPKQVARFPTLESQATQWRAMLVAWFGQLGKMDLRG